MYPANAYIYVHKLELDSHILPQYLEYQFLHIDILYVILAIACMGDWQWLSDLLTTVLNIAEMIFIYMYKEDSIKIKLFTSTNFQYHNSQQIVYVFIKEPVKSYPIWIHTTP